MLRHYKEIRNLNIAKHCMQGFNKAENLTTLTDKIEMKN